MPTMKAKAIVGSAAALVACPGLAILAAAVLVSPLLFVTMAAGRSLDQSARRA